MNVKSNPRNPARTFISACCFRTSIKRDYGIEILSKIDKIEDSGECPNLVIFLREATKKYIDERNDQQLHVMDDLLMKGMVNDLLYRIKISGTSCFTDVNQSLREIITKLDKKSLKEPMETYITRFDKVNTGISLNEVLIPFFESFDEDSVPNHEVRMFKRYMFMLPKKWECWSVEERKMIQSLPLFEKTEEVVFWALKSLVGELEKEISHRFDWVLDYLSSHILLKGIDITWYKERLSNGGVIHYQPPSIDMSTYIKESLYKELNSYFRPTTKVDPFTGLLSIKFKDLQESSELKKIIDKIKNEVGLNVRTISLKNKEQESFLNDDDMHRMHTDIGTVCTLSFPYLLGDNQSAKATEYIKFKKRERANGLPVDTVSLYKRFCSTEQEELLFNDNISLQKAANFELNINIKNHTFHSIPRNPGVRRWFILVFFEEHDSKKLHQNASARLLTSARLLKSI